MESHEKAIFEARIESLNKQLKREHERMWYYRKAAYFMAGFFHQHAVEQGIVLTPEHDLVEWANLKAEERGL
jgi:hypothetical protein